MPIDKPPTQNQFSEQNIQNASFDREFGVSTVEQLGYDGQNMVRQPAEDMQQKVVTSGDYTYICKAAVGTAEATEKWKIFRVDGDGNIMYADADANYDNAATDPTTLTYNYS